MKNFLLLLIALSIWSLLPRDAQAQASRLTTSHTKYSNWNEISQPFRCSHNQGTPNATNGEDCEAGDWSPAIDANGSRFVRVWYRVESGSGNISVYECVPFYGASFPGSNPRPSLTDTDTGSAPLCVNLTAGSGVTMNGAAGGVQYFQFEREHGGLNWIVVELDTESTLTGAVRVEVGK